MLNILARILNVKTKNKIKVQVKQQYLKKLHLKLLPALSLHKSDVAIAEYLDTFFLCVCMIFFLKHMR